MTGRGGFIGGVLLMVVLVFVVWFALQLEGIKAVECTPDHRAWGSPAMQVDVNTYRRVGRIIEYRLPFDCSAFAYSVPSGGPLKGD